MLQSNLNIFCYLSWSTVGIFLLGFGFCFSLSFLSGTRGNAEVPDPRESEASLLFTVLCK